MTLTKRQRPKADSTRNAIFKAARKLFAEHGFAGTSISAIAKKAKVNQSLIYHHFESKEDLWRQTKSESLRQHFNLEAKQLFDTQNLNVFLRDFVTKRFEFYEKNADIRRMIFWQRLEPSPELYGVEKGNKLFTEDLRNLIVNFQKQGEVRSEINPDFAVILLHTICSNLIDDYTFFTELESHIKPSIKKAYVEFIIHSLERVLRD